MRIVKFLLFSLGILVSFNVFSQEISVTVSGDKVVSQNGTFHSLPNTALSFDMSLNAPNDSITKVESFQYTFDGITADVISAVNSGKLSINKVSASSGSRAGTKAYTTILKYFTGDYVSDKWKDDASSHSVTKSVDVRVWDSPKYTMSGRESQTVKGVADNLTWTISAQGGYSDGWKYEWSYDGKSYSGTSFTLPRYENTTSSDQTLRVKLTVKNVAPDGSTEWYSDTKDLVVKVEKAPAVESHADISGYSGKTVNVQLTVQNATSGWSVKWSFNGKSYSANGSSFNISLPYINTDEETYDLNVEVSNTAGFVVNPKQTIKVHVYSTGRVSFDSSVDSTLVNSGSALTLKLSVYGGMPSGWKFVWKDNGTTLDTTTSSSYTFNPQSNSNNYVRHTYSVAISNSIDGVYGFGITEYYYDAVTVYPKPSAPQIVYMRDETRGVETSTYCIREGNYFSLWTTGGCSGGYYESGSSPVWTKQWSGPSGYSSTGDPNYVQVSMVSSSKSQTIENAVYNVHFINYGPYGNRWNDLIAPCNMKVYKKPQTPSTLVIKGNGTSGTLIATTPSLTDRELQEYQYCLVFGYEDSYGIEHDSNPIQQQEGQTRFDFVDANVLSNSSNRLYVYALWIYSDAKVTSGKRYVNSSVNEDWDGSVFGNEPMTRSVEVWSGTGTTGLDGFEPEQESVCIYNIAGQKIDNILNLPAGIYIKETITEGKRSCTKFVVK